MNRHCLLDLDGTLTDSAPGIIGSLEHTLHAMELPCPPRRELDFCLGPPLRESLLRVLQPHGWAHRLEEAVAIYRRHYGEVGIFENRIYDGIPAALEALARSGIRLHLATSKPVYYARQMLDRSGLSRWFTSIHGSELTGERSQKTELIAYVLVNEKIDAATAMMIGDRRHDILGAKANAVKTAGVRWGYGSEAELRTAGADRLLDSPADLPGIFE